MSIGTPADLTWFMSMNAFQNEAARDSLATKADRLRANGYQWFRLTTREWQRRLYLEAWHERPMIEGPLNESAAVVMPEVVP